MTRGTVWPCWISGGRCSRPARSGCRAARPWRGVRPSAWAKSVRVSSGRAARSPARSSRSAAATGSPARSVRRATTYSPGTVTWAARYSVQAGVSQRTPRETLPQARLPGGRKSCGASQAGRGVARAGGWTVTWAWGAVARAASSSQAVASASSGSGSGGAAGVTRRGSASSSPQPRRRQRRGARVLTVIRRGSTGAIQTARRLMTGGAPAASSAPRRAGNRQRPAPRTAALW